MGRGVEHKIKPWQVVVAGAGVVTLGMLAAHNRASTPDQQQPHTNPTPGATLTVGARTLLDNPQRYVGDTLHVTLSQGKNYNPQAPDLASFPGSTVSVNGRPLPIEAELEKASMWQPGALALAPAPGSPSALKDIQRALEEPTKTLHITGKLETGTSLERGTSNASNDTVLVVSKIT